jgi:hypothetical protein
MVELGDTQILIFEIPYGIRIEDGFSFEKEEDSVELDIGQLNEKNQVECRLGNVFANLAFEGIRNQSQVMYDGQFTVEGDRLGRSLSSNVLIHFSDEFMDNIPEEVIEETPEDYHEQGTIMGSDLATPLDKHFVVWGMNFLNRFLESYRFFENEYWIQPLTPQMVQEFHLFRYISGEIDRGRVRNWTGGAVKGGLADIDQIQEFTRSNDQLPLVQRLQLDARDNADRGNYSEAIIQSAQLAEIWTIYAFMIIAKQHGCSESEAEDLITHPDGQYFSPNNIFQRLNSEFSYDFQDTEQYDYWKSSTKEVRDKVVHRGYEPSRSEAMDAVKASLETILEIQTNFDSELRDGKLEEIVEQPLLGSNILISKNE